MAMHPIMTIEHIIDDLSLSLEADADSGDEATEVDAKLLKELRVAAVSQPVILEEPLNAPQMVRREDSNTLDGIAAQIAVCCKCGLHSTRIRTVPGQGSFKPDIMFIGEAPGADEDAQGLAFVGRAGQLLTKMIEAMGYTRESVFIGNILKCRPPKNRAPMPEEMALCLPYLLAQIQVLQPKVIVALGATAVKGLLKTDLAISKIRGNWQTFQNVPLMPTFHPAYLLRNPSSKHAAWADLKEVLARLGKTPPAVAKQ